MARPVLDRSHVRPRHDLEDDVRSVDSSLVAKLAEFGRHQRDVRFLLVETGPDLDVTKTKLSGDFKELAAEPVRGLPLLAAPEPVQQEFDSRYLIPLPCTIRFISGKPTLAAVAIVSS